MSWGICLALRDLDQIMRLGRADPAEALRVLKDADGDLELSRWPLLRAQVALLRNTLLAQLPGRRGHDIRALEEAASVFRVNRWPKEYCASKEGLAWACTAQGRLREGLRHSLEGLRAVDAPVDARLLCARVGLLNLAGPPLSQPRDTLRDEVLQLMANAVSPELRFIMSAVLSEQPFAVALARAGIPSANYPIVPDSVPVSASAARQRASAILLELQELALSARNAAIEHAQPFLLMARIAAFAGNPSECEIFFERARDAGLQEQHEDLLATRALACRYAGAAAESLRQFQSLLPGLGAATSCHWRLAILPPAAAVLRAEGEFEAALGMISEHFLLRDEVNATLIAQVHAHAKENGGDVLGSAPAPGLNGAHDLHLLQSEPPYLRRAMRFLLENYAADISITRLVEESGASRRALEVAFRSYRGTTPAQALRQVRLDAARTLLVSQTLSVAAVSQAVGYKNASAFSRDFRRTYGVSPRQVQRMQVHPLG